MLSIADMNLSHTLPVLFIMHASPTSSESLLWAPPHAHTHMHTLSLFSNMHTSPTHCELLLWAPTHTHTRTQTHTFSFLQHAHISHTVSSSCDLLRHTLPILPNMHTSPTHCELLLWASPHIYTHTFSFLQHTHITDSLWAPPHTHTRTQTHTFSFLQHAHIPHTLWVALVSSSDTHFLFSPTDTHHPHTVSCLLLLLLLPTVALYILYPGLYLLGALLYAFTLIVLRRDIRRARQQFEVVTENQRSWTLCAPPTPSFTHITPLLIFKCHYQWGRLSLFDSL